MPSRFAISSFHRAARRFGAGEITRLRIRRWTDFYIPYVNYLGRLYQTNRRHLHEQVDATRGVRLSKTGLEQAGKNDHRREPRAQSSRTRRHVVSIHRPL